MKKKVNLAAKLAAFDEYFSPKIVGELNDHKLELVKVKGEFVWHSHPNTDDFFLVLAAQRQTTRRTFCSSSRSEARTPATPAAN